MAYKSRSVQKSRRVQKQRQIPDGSGGFTFEPYRDTETYTATESYYVPDTSSGSSYGGDSSYSCGSGSSE